MTIAPISMRQAKVKGILVLAVKWRHHANVKNFTQFNARRSRSTLLRYNYLIDLIPNSENNNYIS